MKYDDDRMQKLISSARECTALLAELRDMAEDEFLKDRHRQSSAKYNFIAAIEAMIDLGHHLISQNRFRSPEDYADAFAVLAENGVVERDFAEELKKMARFRNRLVHYYWNVDEREIYTILRTRLGDFEKFIGQVAGRISEGGQ